MHELQIVHRDLNVDNLLWGRDNYVRITDFGQSKTVAFTAASRQRIDHDGIIPGKSYHIAPELLVRKPYDPYAVDVWSLGVVLLILIAGRMYPVCAFTACNHQAVG